MKVTTTLWDHKSVILKVLVGKTSGKAVEGGRVRLWRVEDEAAPVQLRRRVASREHRPKAARASEF